MHDSDIYAGVGVDNPRDKWVYDTTQFDNILKKLKVVCHIKLPFQLHRLNFDLQRPITVLIFLLSFGGCFSLHN
jgi:hypothetical protein